MDLLQSGSSSLTASYILRPIIFFIGRITFDGMETIELVALVGPDRGEGSLLGLG